MEVLFGPRTHAFAWPQVVSRSEAGRNNRTQQWCFTLLSLLLLLSLKLLFALQRDEVVAVATASQQCCTACESPLKCVWVVRQPLTRARHTPGTSSAPTKNPQQTQFTICRPGSVWCWSEDFPMFVPIFLIFVLHAKKGLSKVTSSTSSGTLTLNPHQV